MIDVSVYEDGTCPKCGKHVLVDSDKPAILREFGGMKHVCGDLGKALHKTYSNDLSTRPKDDLKKSYAKDRTQSIEGRIGEGSMGDNSG